MKRVANGEENGPETTKSAEKPPVRGLAGVCVRRPGGGGGLDGPARPGRQRRGQATAASPAAGWSAA